MIRHSDDPPAPLVKRNLDPPLPAEQLREIIARLAKPALDVGDDKTDGRQETAWKLRVRLDGFAALEDAEKAGVADTALKVFAVEQARSDDVERALKVIETIAEPSQRVAAYRHLADGALRYQAASRRLEVLAKAMPALCAMRDSGTRIPQSAEIAGAMLNLGARDEARKLLADERAAIEALGVSVHGQGQCRLNYAKALCRLDLPAALEMLGTSRLDDQEANAGQYRFVFSRFYGEVAEALAADDPQAALRVLPLIRSDAERDEAVPRICRVLAKTDRAAAERVARSIHANRIYLRAWALGLIAETLAAADRQAAEMLLGEAFGHLEYAAEDLRIQSVVADGELTELGCVLAEIAERVAPDRVEEFLWRTVALRPPRVGVTSEFYFYRSIPTLAGALSFYDRKLASFVLGPPGRDNFSGWSTMAADIELAERVQALALIDPRAAAALAEDAPADHKCMRPDWEPRERVIEVLGTPAAHRWRKYFCPLLRDRFDE